MMNRQCKCLLFCVAQQSTSDRNVSYVNLWEESQVYIRNTHFTSAITINLFRYLFQTKQKQGKHFGFHHLNKLYQSDQLRHLFLLFSPIITSSAIFIPFVCQINHQCMFRNESTWLTGLISSTFIKPLFEKKAVF